MSLGHVPQTDLETPSAAEGIVRLTEPGPLVYELYDSVFEPSFHPDELCSRDTLQSMVQRGVGDCWVSLGPGGEVLGGLMGEWDADPGVMLVAWIATRPGLRGSGVGGPLLDVAVASWKDRFDPCLILAEIEDPAHHAAEEAHGDPAARLAFYRRHGSRVLELPYFQAALGSERQRIDPLLLMLLHAHPSFDGPEPGTLGGKAMREYIELYQRACEGAVGTDEQAMRLWDAIDRPGGIRILP
jgi:GNAT superfamily N-acetyltransferase